MNGLFHLFVNEFEKWILRDILEQRWYTHGVRHYNKWELPAIVGIETWAVLVIEKKSYQGKNIDLRLSVADISQQESFFFEWSVT